VTGPPTQAIPLIAPERVAMRSTATGHRITDARTGGAPTPTRRLPVWIWPLELAARWRARTEGRWG
jgi:hypothetical protein